MGCISGVLKRYRRGAEYFFTSFFVEKPNGLDFSMRARDGWRAGNNGYSLTPKDLFNELFTHVPPRVQTIALSTLVAEKVGCCAMLWVIPLVA